MKYEDVSVKIKASVIGASGWRARGGAAYSALTHVNIVHVTAESQRRANHVSLYPNMPASLIKR
jgi:hypothetical protein